MFHPTNWKYSGWKLHIKVPSELATYRGKYEEESICFHQKISGH